MHHLVAGRRVVLIDDVLVSGETMRRHLADLHELENPPAEIRSSVAVISSDAVLDRETVSELGVLPVEVPGDHVHQLASQLASCLGDGLIPFFTDFPVTTETTVSHDTLAAALGGTPWTVVDVTTAQLGLSGVRSISLLPPPEVVDRFAGSLGGEFGFKIIKFRLFVRDDPYEPRLRVVPIVVPDQLLGCDQLADTQSGSLPNGAAVFLLSMRFLLFAMEELDLLTEVQLDNMYDNLAALTATQAVDAAPLARFTPLAEPATSDESLPDARISFPSELRDPGSFVIGDDLVDPLVEQCAQWFTVEHRDPVSLAEVAAVLGAEQAQASLVLDVLNDLGFLVPRPSEYGRVYRPGESFLIDPGVATVGLLGGRYASRARTIEWTSEGYSQPLLGH
jgi:hypothetical protein